MDYREKWRIVEFIGEGGQAKVHRVFNIDEGSDIKSTLVDSLRNLTQAVSYTQIREENYENFSNAILEMIKVQDPSRHGALKVLHDPEQARDAGLATQRIKDEILL